MKNLKLKLLAGSAVALVSDVALAIPETDLTALKKAYTDGGTAMGAVVTGVIAIGATITALGLIFNWLKR